MAGLTGAAGPRANLLVLLGLAAGVAMALVAIGADLPTAANATGLFASAMTSTAALQAAVDAAGLQDSTVGYSVAYPFGVMGPILCMYHIQVLTRAKVEAPSLQGLHYAENAIRDPEAAGRTPAELVTRLLAGVMITAIRQQHRNLVPRDEVDARSGLPSFTLPVSAPPWAFPLTNDFSRGTSNPGR